MPTLLDLIPHNPVTDFLRRSLTGGEAAEHRSYFIIKRLDTGEEFRFQFAPSINMSINNEIPFHQGVRSDEPIPTPLRGGARTFYISGMFYKVDRAYNINVWTENLMALARQKDGKLPILLLHRPGRATTKVYCQSMSLRYPQDMVTAVAPDEPRYIEVSMEFVKYLPLPTPKVSSKAPPSTAFYTAEEATDKKKATTHSKSNKDVLQGILSNAAQGEENEPPLDGEELGGGS